ncbi:MAG: MATE family efflux transporter [Halobacteriovoraceae bacterium]|nr:MATE family efflux transporter [Halobacteriovoraceae bacterium]MBT5092673.1 MATE family efflux transporter [Halobacteriovoraceae bacterium]
MNRYLSGLKEVFFFSLPLIAGQVGQMLFGIGDIVVAGRYSTEVVSALGIATGIFAPFVMVGLGLTYAVSPIAAKYRGQGEEKEQILYTSLIGTAAAAFLLLMVFLIVIFNLSLFNFSPNIEALVYSYLKICSISIIPLMLFQTIKEYLQAFDLTYFANGTILGFNVINVGLNIVLMFGLWGIPELGIQGAAWATTFSRTAMAILIYIYAQKKITSERSLDRHLLKEITKLGIPISLGIFVEVLVFSFVTVIIGKMNIIASASHNIVLNLASMTFMVPVAISSAAAVKVGGEFGRSNNDGVLYYALASLSITFLFMGFSASCYFFFPESLIKLATPDQKLIEYGSGLLIFVALFQIPDGLQITLLGILRGLGITKIPMLITFAANWLIGLPIGLYLVNSRNMEAAGLWAGLAAGLSALFIGLSILFYNKYRNLQAVKLVS